VCGIAGIFNLNGEAAERSHMRSMIERIAHRGPDGDGLYAEEHVALGHKRLAILDTSEKGAQPMHSRNREWVVVFNGCIYNYRALRKELQSVGSTFISNTDTEVIAEGLAVFGPEYLERFNGMFAVAAYHIKTRILYLSRDRYGIKPLYYWHHGNVFLFASEVKAFMGHPAFKVELNPVALNEYFTFQNLFTYQTLFKGVTLLPPANTVKIENLDIRTLKHKSWWDYDFSSPDEQMTFLDAQMETERLFKIAVERQMVSDVPVGSYLSGGMDSGSITAIASQHVKRLTTFTAGFDLSQVTGVESNYDERRAAELMANYFGTEHYEQVINAGDLSWSLPRVVWHIEDLRVGMSYPNYYISRLASKFVKVCLQGTGGDELYGGYPWRYYKIFKSVDRQTFFDSYYGFWQRLVSDEDKSKLFNKNILDQIDVLEPRKIFERVFTFNNKLKYSTPEEHVQNSLYFEIKTFLPGLLLIGDKLSMANGLEERFPFLDNDLVNFSQKIPIRHKLGNFESNKSLNENFIGSKKAAYQEYDDGKNVLRKAMMDFLPESILNRKKQGFSAPDESWYRGENANYIRELLFDKNAICLEYINEAYIHKIVNEHNNQRINHRLLIWSFMCFEWWCKLFLKGEKFE
jgi:asparagine synthase (glutamine-hydrolysing)